MPNTNKYTVDGAVRAQIKEAITKFLADKAASRARMYAAIVPNYGICMDTKRVWLDARAPFIGSVMIGNYEEGLAGLDTEYGSVMIGNYEEGLAGLDTEY